MTRGSLQSIRRWMNELKPLVPPSKEEGGYTLPQIAIQEIDRVSEGMSDYIDTLEARVERWKRMAMAHAAYEDALLFAVGADEQEAARAELRAAHADLKAHGDLPNDGSDDR